VRMAKAAIDLGKPYSVVSAYSYCTELVVRRLHGRTGRGPETGVDTAHRTTPITRDSTPEPAP
jgi:hypothetical protein